MTEEAKRAIDRLVAVSGDTYFRDDLITKKALSLAISAIQQREAAIAECKKSISDIGHTSPYIAACETILEILEDKV